MKEYEKLIGFTILLGAICWLAWMGTGQQSYVMVDGKPISVSNGGALRDVLVGMIGVLGMAGQALFRTNEMAGAMNDLLKSAVEKLGNSAPAQPPSDPPPADVIEAVDDVANAAVDKATAIKAKP